MDDVAVPARDAYGAQPPIELLRYEDFDTNWFNEIYSSSQHADNG